MCIPDIQDVKSDQELLALSGAQHVLRPSIEASETALRTILDEIAAADFVLTGSLHGAIVACAYGRPFAFWNSGHIDVPFKWHDFAASVGIPAVFVTTLDEGRRVYETELAPRLTLPALAILDVCPFQVRPSACALSPTTVSWKSNWHRPRHRRSTRFRRCACRMSTAFKTCRLPTAWRCARSVQCCVRMQGKRCCRPSAAFPGRALTERPHFAFERLQGIDDMRAE